MKKQKGIALIMALYVTAIVFAIGTFFMADQINKSRTILDYKDSKVALQAANLGLNFFLNYFGNIRNNWADAVLFKDSGGTVICQGGADGTITVAGTSFTVKAGPAGYKWLSSVTGGVNENDYSFSLSAKTPISVVSSEGKFAKLHGIIKVFYYPNRAFGEGCAALTATSPLALSSISIEVNSEITDKDGKYTYAYRTVRWTGWRNVGNFEAYYQCWTCWDIPGYKYPNKTAGTDATSFLGYGFNSGGVIMNLANPTSATGGGDRSGIPLTQSAYGTENNGSYNVISPGTGTGIPPIPELNGPVFAVGNINTYTYSNGTLTPLKDTSGILNNKSDSGLGAGEAVPLLTGAPYGPASSSGGTPNTAPASMVDKFDQAANDAGCNGTVKTVFVTSNQDRGLVTPGAGGTGHDIEYPSTLGTSTLKPGYAVTDITLNGDGTVSIEKLGYYSGATLFKEKLDPSTLSNQTIYVQGGNVRIHGDLQKAGLTVIANQGDGFYDDSGAQLTAAPRGNKTSLTSPTNCFAANTGQTLAFSINSAVRFRSDKGQTTSPGQDYWIPNADISKLPCAGNINNCAQYFKPSSDSNCSNCLYDGIYQISRTTDSSGNSTINAIGYHADDTFGQPATLANLKCAKCDGTDWTTTDTNFSSTLFAPAPKFKSDGTYDATSAPLTPVSVQQVDSSGNPIGSPQQFWPYPGASAVSQLQNNPGNFQDYAFYTRQFANGGGEGNVTFSGDTDFQGAGVNLGVIAKNYVLLNDFVSGGYSGGTSDKYSTGDPNFNVRASMLSATRSMQWEGNLQVDPYATTTKYANDTYVNGDYVALNGQHPGAGQPDYKYTYMDKTGATHTAVATSYQGAPLNPPTPCFTPPCAVSPLIPTNNAKRLSWNFQFTGFSSSPYQDVVSSTDNNGNYYGYIDEHMNSDPVNVVNPPPDFPVWSFAELQTMGIPAMYVTLSYSDLGALHAGP